MVDLDSLALIGATQVMIDFGPNASIQMRLSETEREGWDVWDNSRRYSHQIAASLDLETAVRFAIANAKRTSLTSSEAKGGDGG